MGEREASLMRRHLLFFGPPGSGKSTQGALLSAKRGIPHVSIGDLLRAEVRSGSARGQTFAAHMGQGGMVSDATVDEILREHLVGSAIEKGFILDGFPRAEQQLPLLERLVADLGLEEYRAVDITIPRAESFARLVSRGRGDDNPEVIDRRLDAYAMLAEPVLRYFAQRQVLVVVDGLGDIDEVAGRLDEALDGLEPTSWPENG